MVYRKLLYCVKLSNGVMVELLIAGAVLRYQRVFFSCLKNGTTFQQS